MHKILLFFYYHTMYIIQSVRARELLDSRGNPTVEAEITLQSWASGRAIVPSGASTGTHEACELRDNDTSRYLGKGVLNAVRNVNTTISDAIQGQNYSSLLEFDTTLIKLDNTTNKTNLWANAILACSMAFTVAMANQNQEPLYKTIAQQANEDTTQFSLPLPLMNIINGGAHADNKLDFQELMIIPQWAPNLAEAVRMGAEVFHHLKKILKNNGYSTAVGDEWWYAPAIQSNHEWLDLIMQAITEAGYTSKQITIGLDVASTEFYKDGLYCFEWKQLSSAQMVDYYLDLMKTFPIVSIEDGFAEDDFAGWTLCQEIFEKNWFWHIRTVGDDLYVTNVERLQMGIDQQMSNSILIKLNQIGTVSETINAIQLAHKHNMHSIVSHRSGETEDSFIADLAVAMKSKYIKTGSLSRSDRIAKYNQLIRIEEQLQK